MPVTVNIDLKGVEAKLRKARAQVEEQLVAELNRFGTLTVNDAKQAAPVDEGFLRNSIAFEPATAKKLTIKIIVACNYAAFIEFGTRKFAAAYVATLPATWQAYAASFKGKSGGSMEDFIMKLMAWVKRKGIGATFSVLTHRRDKIGKQTIAQTEEADAYAIALYILRNGIQPHPFLFPAVQKNEIELQNRLK